MSPLLEIVGPALCAWRENEGGGQPGMQSVLNVLANRAARDGTTIWQEAIKRAQFSSLTSPGNPRLTAWPDATDLIDYAVYQIAEGLSVKAAAGFLPDLTDGATVYYAPDGLGPTTKTFTLPGETPVPFPQDWNEAALEFTVSIANQIFFKELT